MSHLELSFVVEIPNVRIKKKLPLPGGAASLARDQGRAGAGKDFFVVDIFYFTQGESSGRVGLKVFFMRGRARDVTQAPLKKHANLFLFFHVGTGHPGGIF